VAPAADDIAGRIIENRGDDLGVLIDGYAQAVTCTWSGDWNSSRE
jgi:hypothetical protein